MGWKGEKFPFFEFIGGFSLHEYLSLSRLVAIGNWCLGGEGFGVKVPKVFSNVKATCLFEHPMLLLRRKFPKNQPSKQLPRYCNSIVLDFFMQKPIAQWVVYIIILNWKGLNDIRSWWQLSWRTLKFWNRLYLLNYSQWLDNNVHVFLLV